MKVIFTRKYLIILLVLGASFGGGYAAYKEVIYWKKEFAIDRGIQRVIDFHKINEIRDFHARVDFVRDFVVKNTSHQGGDKFSSYWRNMPRMVDIFYSYSTGESTEILEAECSVRSGFMMKILELCGDQVRGASIYAAPNASHTFLEVFNQETGRWEVQDPDYGIYWVNGEGQRASIEELVASPHLEAMYTPCGSKGCGWSSWGKEGQDSKHLVSFLGLAVRGRDDKVLFYNAQRYKEKGGLKAYCQSIPKNCKRSVVRFSGEKAS